MPKFGLPEAWTILVHILGLILLIAAVLKAHSIATMLSVGRNWGDNSALLTILVGLEAIFGLWLLTGLHARWTWWAALGTFTLFLPVALYKALSGAESCGCFGPIRVNPWYTVGFDLAAVAAILACHKIRHATPIPPRFVTLRWTVMLIVTIASVAGGAFIVTRSPQAQIDEDGMIRAQGLLILEPHKWIAKSFPLAKHIDIGPTLAHGSWTVVLYRWDCGHCREVIQKMDGVPRDAFVELPPYAPPGRSPVSLNTSAVVGRLSDQEEWFASTPVILKLKDGIVLEAAEGEYAEKLIF